MILIAGKPAGNVICSEAKTQKVDLVITGCRGLSKARRTILGSVSDYVVHHSGLPVCVVPPPLKNMTNEKYSGTQIWFQLQLDILLQEKNTFWFTHEAFIFHKRLNNWEWGPY